MPSTSRIQLNETALVRLLECRTTSERDRALVELMTGCAPLTAIAVWRCVAIGSSSPAWREVMAHGNSSRLPRAELVGATLAENWDGELSSGAAVVRVEPSAKSIALVLGEGSPTTAIDLASALLTLHALVDDGSESSPYAPPLPRRPTTPEEPAEDD